MLVKPINIIQSNRGSLTIEAAIILPMVITVFLIFFTLIYMAYVHVHMQIILNDVCEEISEESYLLYKTGLTELIQNTVNLAGKEAMSYEELKRLIDKEESVINTSGGEVRKEYLKEGLNEPSLIPDFFLFHYDKISRELKTLGYTLKLGSKIASTGVREGIYFATTSLYREIFREKMDERLSDSTLEAVDYRIEHLDGFIDDDTGRIILSYTMRLPIGVGMKKQVKLVNSSYIHVFSGYGSYAVKHLEDTKTSHYGEGDEGADESDSEDDKYASKVYVTENGTKYHKKETCFHIYVPYYGKRLLSVKGRRPCEYCCNEKIAETSIVYLTSSGDVYHASPTCHAIHHNIHTLSEKEAIVKGYSPCNTCSKE